MTASSTRERLTVNRSIASFRGVRRGKQVTVSTIEYADDSILRDADFGPWEGETIIFVGGRVALLRRHRFADYGAPFHRRCVTTSKAA